MPGILHLVIWAFKPDVSPEDRQKVCDEMIALKDKCVHPTSQRSYIKTSSGGADVSTENLQQGMTHAFVVEFETVEDRDYYVSKDPAHAAFVQFAKKYWGNIQVIDFAPGSF